jgi:hypothetical protein
MELDQINIFVVNDVSLTWLSEHMEDIEHGRPIVFIRHRRETQGYHRVSNEDRWGGQYRIERVDNRTELD